MATPRDRIDAGLHMTLATASSASRTADSRSFNAASS
jgi:hypothetical protein